MHGWRSKIPSKNLVRRRCAEGFSSDVKGLNMGSFKFKSHCGRYLWVWIHTYINTYIHIYRPIYIVEGTIWRPAHLLLACSLTFLWLNITNINTINKYMFPSGNGTNGFIKATKLFKKCSSLHSFLYNRIKCKNGIYKLKPQLSSSHYLIKILKHLYN
jgi:hypothetical protein